MSENENDYSRTCAPCRHYAHHQCLDAADSHCICAHHGHKIILPGTEQINELGEAFDYFCQHHVITDRTLREMFYHGYFMAKLRYTGNAPTGHVADPPSYYDIGR